MSRVVELLCSSRVPQVAVLALMSIGFAGCSADMSTRLSENPFSTPFASQQEATGSVPAPAVERRELPQYARPQTQYPSSSLPPAIAAPQSYPRASNGVSGGGRGLASYAPPAHPIETTGSVAPRSVAAAHGAGQGGTTIIVGTSDTLDTLARRYNVSPAAILQANGYKGPRALSPGQQLIIPHPDAAVAAAPALVAPASTPVAVAGGAAVPPVHVVNHGDTLLSIARRNHVSVAELAKANNIDPQAKLKLGMKLTVPAANTAAAAPAAQPAVAAAQPVAPQGTKMAAGGPAQSARLAQAAPTPADNSVEPAVKAPEATGAL